MTEDSMTIYEIVSIAISIIAIFIPIFQWLWNKFIKRPKINNYYNSPAFLYYNQSGAYIRIDCAFEAQNKPISIKKINLVIKRRSDEKKLNLSWSTFISPTTQSFIGAFTQTTEKAHPFRIDSDNIMCACIEFSDEYNLVWKKSCSFSKELSSEIINIRNNFTNYDEALNEFQKLEKYTEMKQMINDHFFCVIGKYDVDMIVCYGKTEKTFRYSIDISEQISNNLKPNIEESIICELKKAYGIPNDFHIESVDIDER